MKTLVILNDAPYGTERSYNALRLAGALSKDGAQEVRVFLMGDAAACAKNGQKVPNGHYNLSRMVSAVAMRQVPVAICGTCMDARGIASSELVDGTRRGTLEELATWTTWADKVVVF